MSNVFVAVRIRPLIGREISHNEVSIVEANENTVHMRESMNQQNDDTNVYSTYKFTYDAVFNEETTQEEVYTKAAQQTVTNFLEGYNGCIMAYGQTGSGKTHTIMSSEFDGVIPQTIYEIFDYFQTKTAVNSNNQFVLRASYYQIYNENVLDLLNPTQINLKIREVQHQIYVENLSYFQLTCPQDLEKLIKIGNTNRIQAETKMNTNSSRSHSILTLYLDQSLFIKNELVQTSSKLQILDLAGSERAHSTQPERQRETKHINQSLAILGNVMQQIVQNQQNSTHIQFRDSKLTRILQDSVGGNCKTVLITNISPSNACFYETLNSLKFADRAKQIKQHAEINQIEDFSVRIQKYRLEIQRLQQKINEKGNPEEQQMQQQLQKQVDMLKSQIQSPKFDEFQKLFQQIKQLDEVRSQSANQQDQLNNLRNQSIKQRDILLILTSKLQEKETQIQQFLKELQDCYQQIAQSEEKIYQSGQNVDDNDEEEYTIDISQNTETDQILSYEQKMDELVQLKEEFTEENVQLEREWKQMQLQIKYEQKSLEDRADIVMRQVQVESADYLTECLKERDALIKIFAERVIPSVNELKKHDSKTAANNNDHSLQEKAKNLQIYIRNVRELIETSELRQKLQELFE
ncbi:Kinesin-16 [Hexamita inflata]|uniref:Kinesin-16 n=1 Tax=Hexamita inflata TaxID=28002 RepID=A0AA86PNA3_9EUKA|nr:Kinesin-16 [Hexamita inflata]